MSKYLLQEDDCAPDAREYFDKDMVRLTGMTTSEFQRHPDTVRGNDTEMHREEVNGDFVLSYDGDDPCYKLEKIEKLEKKG